MNSKIQSLTPEELILKSLVNEYENDTILKERLLNKVTLLRELSNDRLIYSISYHSRKRQLFIAQLYLIANGRIQQQIERINYKYHPGFFRTSDKLGLGQNEIRYEILLPTSSVAHAVTEHEYFEVKQDAVFSLVKFLYREVSCVNNDGPGLLIEKDIFKKPNGYAFNKKTYSFSCEDFDFRGNIEDLKLINEEVEK